jgi:hypothetical protein
VLDIVKTAWLVEYGESSVSSEISKWSVILDELLLRNDQYRQRIEA